MLYCRKILWQLWSQAKSHEEGIWGNRPEARYPIVILTMAKLATVEDNMSSQVKAKIFMHNLGVDFCGDSKHFLANQYKNGVKGIYPDSLVNAQCSVSTFLSKNPYTSSYSCEGIVFTSQGGWGSHGGYVGGGNDGHVCGGHVVTQIGMDISSAIAVVSLAILLQTTLRMRR